MRHDPAEAVVRHLLAEGQVEVSKVRKVTVERRVERTVGEVVAARQVNCKRPYFALT